MSSCRVSGTKTLCTLFACCLLSVQVQAGTIVQVQTSLGAFYLELNDQAAPITVNNFLNYVNSGRYDHTFIHEVTGRTFIRGGGFTWNNCSQGLIPVAADAPIPFEDTGLSNLHGTIAMHRLDNDVNSATSRWFINNGDDPDSDTRNGGYVVFGEVIGDGMSVVREISIAPGVHLGFVHETPTISYFEEFLECELFNQSNLILVLMDVIAPDQGEASANYDSSSGLLEINIDLGADGFFTQTYSVSLGESQSVISRMDGATLQLSQPVPNMGRFDSYLGELTLPSVAIDGEIMFRNVVFRASETDSAVLVLSAFEAVQ